MYTCSDLYASIALESFFTVIMGLAFAYLLLLITNRGRLQRPGRALLSWVWKMYHSFQTDVLNEVSRWPEAPNLSLDKRFAICRKANQAICSLQIVLVFLTMSRWLHINNVNGFRYLGYAVTCPPMQAELVLMIAPVVPCYKVVVIFTWFITFAMLISGYAASLIQTDLYTGSIYEWETLEFTNKFYALLPSAIILCFLTFLQLPLLGLRYICKGGVNGGLPHGYLRMLFVVAVTWFAFPLWWLLSYEGMAIISDTKMNAVGFAFLNVVSKGTFTLRLLSMTKWHREDKMRKELEEKARQEGVGASQSIDSVGIFDFDRAESTKSKRKQSRAETWVVTALRPFDDTAKRSDPWIKLDAQRRAYVLGRGITPNQFRSMSAKDREEMETMFQSLEDLINNDAASMSNKTEQAISLGSRIDGPCHQGDAVSDKLVSDKPVSDKLDPVMESSLEVGPIHAMTAFEVGQLLTTRHGQEGLVSTSGADRVTVTTLDGEQFTVLASDVTKIHIRLMRARVAPSSSKRLLGHLYCACRIEGKPSTEVKSSTVLEATSQHWDTEVDVLGFSLGDSVSVALCREGGAAVGHALLKTDDFAFDRFEGEMQLSMNGEATGVFLRMAVEGFNVPPRGQGLCGESLEVVV